MDASMKAVNNFVKTSKMGLDFVVSNKTTKALVVFVVAMYISVYTSSLNRRVIEVLENKILRFVFFFLGFYVTSENVMTSVILTALVIVFDMLVKMFLKENFELIWPEPVAPPYCLKVNMKELLEPFNGNVEDLKRVMLQLGVPGDLEINDTNAPMIATYLYTLGYKFGETCKFPPEQKDSGLDGVKQPMLEKVPINGKMVEVKEV